MVVWWLSNGVEFVCVLDSQTAKQQPGSDAAPDPGFYPTRQERAGSMRERTYPIPHRCMSQSVGSASHFASGVLGRDRGLAETPDPKFGLRVGSGVEGTTRVPQCC